VPLPGFTRDELKPRYDVGAIREDEWHSYSGDQTTRIIQAELSTFDHPPSWLLNAGSGIYALGPHQWHEVRCDLFAAPIKGGGLSVCGSIQQLPFSDSAFGAVVCVGEVLAYCDPAATAREFARVLAPSGILISDFGSSRSMRRLLSSSFGRAADLVTDDYNGSPEKTWIYNPDYILALLANLGFRIQKTLGTHTWSALARRLGCSPRLAVSIQRRLEWLRLPAAAADVITVVAVRG
jgi:SAM-dependent methyltransferase